MSLPSQYAKVRFGHDGKVVADVHKDGFIIDRLIGYTKQDCVESVRLQYPGMLIIDTDGKKLKTRLVKDERDSPAGMIFAYTQIDSAVEQILSEIIYDRSQGKIAPFVEGTPIGVIPPEYRMDKT